MIGKFKWQDIAITIASLIFAPSLVVSIINGTQMPLGTTIPTVIGLCIIVVANYSLKLWLASITTALTAICWLILVFI